MTVRPGLPSLLLCVLVGGAGAAAAMPGFVAVTAGEVDEARVPAAEVEELENGRFGAGVGSAEDVGGFDLCSDDSECGDRHCVDGVCCRQAACQVCERCDVPGSSGQCAALGELGNPCSDGEQCRSGFCVDGSCCEAPACPVGKFCSSGRCMGPLVDGHCFAGEQCDPPFCVDGVCCEAAACGPSERCDVPRFEGTCTDPSGPGPRSFGKPCDSPSDCDPRFHCTDGVCCEDVDCGPWHQCNRPGREGQCAVVPSLVERQNSCEEIGDDGGADGCAVGVGRGSPAGGLCANVLAIGAVLGGRWYNRHRARRLQGKCRPHHLRRRPVGKSSKCVLDGGQGRHAA